MSTWHVLDMPGDWKASRPHEGHVLYALVPHSCLPPQSLSAFTAAAAANATMLLFWLLIGISSLQQPKLQPVHASMVTKSRSTFKKEALP